MVIGISRSRGWGPVREADPVLLPVQAVLIKAAEHPAFLVKGNTRGVDAHEGGGVVFFIPDTGQGVGVEDLFTVGAVGVVDEKPPPGTDGTG